MSVSSATNQSLKPANVTAGEMTVDGLIGLSINGEKIGIIYPHPKIDGLAAKQAQHIAARYNAANKLISALGSLGVIGNGYCFCSEDRDPDKTDHEPECAEARDVLASVGGWL